MPLAQLWIVRHFFYWAVFILMGGLVFATFAGGLEELNSYGIRFKMVQAAATSFPILEMGRLVEMPQIDNHTGGQVLAYDQPILEVLRSIQEKYGFVELDCGTFVQLAAQILKDREKTIQTKKFILFPRGTFSVDFANRVFGMKFGYIQPGRADVAELMQKTSFVMKGHWVLGMDENRYLGLRGSNPLVASAREWMQLTRDDLFQEIRVRHEAEKAAGHIQKCPEVLQILTPAGRARLKTRLASLMRIAGDFNLWTIRLPKS